MAVSNRTPAFTQVTYAVNTTGDAWYCPTIRTSDSPDLSTAPDKAAAVAQCALNSPEGVEILGT